MKTLTLVVLLPILFCGCPLTQVQRDDLSQKAIDCTKFVRDNGFKQVSECALAAIATPCPFDKPECWASSMLSCAETKGIADAVSIAICEIGVAGEAIAYALRNMGGGPDAGEFGSDGVLVRVGKIEQLARIRVMQRFWPVRVAAGATRK